MAATSRVIPEEQQRLFDEMTADLDEPIWRLNEETKLVGRRGLAIARKELVEHGGPNGGAHNN